MRFRSLFLGFSALLFAGALFIVSARPSLADANGCVEQGGTCSYNTQVCSIDKTYVPSNSCQGGVCCVPRSLGVPTATSTAAAGGSSASCTGSYGFPDPLCGAEIPDIVNRLITAALGLSGSLFFVYFLWGGFKYMTAGGDAKDVQAAQKTLTNAVIGLVIIGLSYALVTSIINILAAGGGS